MDSRLGSDEVSPTCYKVGQVVVQRSVYFFWAD